MDQQLAIVFDITEETGSTPATTDLVELTITELGQVAGGTTYVLY
jgi:hypothetical protein